MAPRPSSPNLIRHARRVVAVCIGVVVACAIAALGAAVAAEGRGSKIAPDVRQRAALRGEVAAKLEKAERRAPRAVGERCRATTNVPGQGASCRTADGMYVLPQSDGSSITTHGPDLVNALEAPSTARAGGTGFGTTESIVCSSPLRTRNVQLAYLIPADYGSGGADVRGDRYAEQAQVLRAALYDTSAMIDRRAGELAPGQRRRLRVACGVDGAPSVLRIVLPRTAAAYRTAGFAALRDDLMQLGALREHVGYSRARLPALRRLLAYYDADFVRGVVGQGTMYRSASLTGAEEDPLPPSHPLVSTTTRNINNNAPDDSLAVQYGTSYGGVPDPPLYTGLLHELSHTMGAVQDEPPTSSGRGHCLDGLDIMCYDDSTSGDAAYVETACPDAVPPIGPEDEQFDCNGDTYFHPAPPAGNPLAAARTWHLGRTSNETLTPDTTAAPAPGGVVGFAVRGTGTKLAMRWDPVAGDAGRTYEVLLTPAGGATQVVSAGTARVFAPVLRPATTYELAVRAVDRNGDVGAAAVGSRRTGRDTSPPTRPLAAARLAVTRSTARLRWRLSTDNVRVRFYRVERQVGRRWVLAKVAGVRAARGVVTSPVIGGLRPGTTTKLRVRAVDVAGNTSLPSATVTITTRR
ncbi:MAG: hypothetical protein JWM90_2347 [Thermoleophilia bacterium]|nr:hypothetical protein [Thermoleophilia bacterium]